VSEVVDGARETARGLYVHESGDGPLVVLVHGVMDRSSGMLRTRRLLHPAFRIVRYDRRGYGRSKAAEPTRVFDDQVDDLVEVLGGRPAVLVGHSFGGVVSLALAQRRPELVRSLVAYEAPMMWTEWWPGSSASTRLAGTDPVEEDPQAAAEWFMRRMIGDDMWERLPRSLRADRRSEGPALLADMRSVQPPNPPPYEPELVGVPVLSAYGGASRPRHRQAAEELAERAPDAELRVVDGADHGVHLSDPAGFAELIRRGVERAQGR
jgi:pimeloyl-ACP methyl ester carboxylesterase